MIYLLILLAGGFLSYFGPWWIIAPVAWIVCRWKARAASQAIKQSASAVGTLWLSYAVYIHFVTDGTITNHMSGILTSTENGPGTGTNTVLIFGIVIVLSGLIGGLSGLAGYRMKGLEK